MTTGTTNAVEQTMKIVWGDIQKSPSFKASIAQPDNEKLSDSYLAFVRQVLINEEYTARLSVYDLTKVVESLLVISERRLAVNEDYDSKPISELVYTAIARLAARMDVHASPQRRM